MKTLLLGITLIVLLGLGGFMYRNAVEYAKTPVRCPVESFTCPDGTVLQHLGLTCSFPTCPLPNVTLANLGISYAIPAGYTTKSAGPGLAAAYEAPIASSTERRSIRIRRYEIQASSTALATIQESAINATADLPVSPSLYSSVTLGGRTYTVVPIDRFEGVVDVAYYLARTTDVLRFDAIDRGVDWTNPSLDVASLPAQAALRGLLTTLQSE